MQDGSKVSHFAQGLPGFEYDEEKPYAEVSHRLYYRQDAKGMRHANELVSSVRTKVVDGNSSLLSFDAAFFRTITQGLSI